MQKKPILFAVDDDSDITRAISLFVSNIGFQVATFNTPEQYLAKLQNQAPDICLIDIMYANQPHGFELVQKTRTIFKGRVPIIVMSGNTDLYTVTHAIEIGANDFVMKPIDKDLLISKVSRFMATGDLIENKYPSVSLGKQGESASLSVEFEALEVDEFGIALKSPHVVTKGTVVQMRGPLIESILKTEAPLLMSISSSWLLPDGQNFGAYAEFDISNDKLLTQVRKWLASDN